MKHIKTSILFTLLLLVFLLMSCDAIFIPTTAATAPSSAQIHNTLQEEDQLISSEVSNAFINEQQIKEHRTQNTRKTKYDYLKKSAQESEMMDIASQEFREQDSKK